MLKSFHIQPCFSEKLQADMQYIKFFTIILETQSRLLFQYMIFWQGRHDEVYNMILLFFKEHNKGKRFPNNIIIRRFEPRSL